MKGSRYSYVTAIIIAAFAVITCAGDVHADFFGQKRPSFDGLAPGDPGVPSKAITVTDIGYGARELFWDNDSKAFWWFNNGRWAGCFQNARNGRGFVCYEIRSNGVVTATYQEKDTVLDADGYIVMSGVVTETGRSWVANYHFK